MRKLAIACLAGLMAGCSGLDNLVPTSAPSGITDATSREAVRIFSRTGACPAAALANPPPATPPETSGVAPPLAIPPALIAPLAGIGANLAISAISDALKAAQDNLTTSYLATGTGAIGSEDCWIIVRGRFGTPLQARAAMQGRLPPQTLTELGLVDYPDLYLEVSIRRLAPAPGAGAPRRAAQAAPIRLVMRPEFLQFGDTAARNRGNGRKHIVVALGARLEPASSSGPASEATATSGAAAAVVFNLGEVRVGTVLAPAPGAPAPFAEQERVVTLAADATGTGQLNLAGFITETGDRSKALALLTAAFDSEKATLEQVLKDFLKKVLGEKPSGG